MTKLSQREKILTEGLRVVHARGYAGASVRDIVAAAGVPQGTFTNYFDSKEAFGLEILDIYSANRREMIGATLANPALPPLQRMAAWLDATLDCMSADGMRNGCLFGNFSAETTDHSEAIRERLVAIFGELETSVADCLQAAVAAHELPDDFACDAVAGVVVATLQGACLLAKTQRSAEPLLGFRKVLFSTILR